MLLSEPLKADVEGMIASGAVSAVNLAEVVTKLVEHGVTPIAIQSSLSRLGMGVVPFDAEQSMQTGLLREGTRHLGLSLGDRACIALAQQLKLPVLTTDRVWKDLDVGVEVRVVR